MSLKTGDILKVTCSGTALCYHLGVVVIDEENRVIVYHNTPTLQNAFGGNVVSESYRDFMRGRVLIGITPATRDQDAQDIAAYAFENRARTWNAVAYNCETFASEAATSTATSAFAAAVVVAVALSAAAVL